MNHKIVWKIIRSPGIYIGFILLIIILINSFFYWLISQEKYIYFWDYATYWTIYQQLGELAHRNLLLALLITWNSTLILDYNYLPALFLLPGYILFGTSKLAYILTVVNIYFIPTVLLFGILMQQISKPFIKHTKLPFIFCVLLLLLSPQIHIPILYGYVDIVGITIIFIILLLNYSNYSKNYSLKQQILLGILLGLLIILRRYYSIWVLGFICGLFVDIFIQKNIKLPEALKRLKNLLFISIACISFLLIFALPISILHLLTPYRTIYGAYRSSDSLILQSITAITQFNNYFGFLFTFIFLISIILALYPKNLRRFSTFLLIQFLIIFLSFTYIQNFDKHHYYLLIPTMYVFMGIFFIKIMFLIKRRIYRIAILLLISIYLVSNFIIVFTSSKKFTENPITYIFSQARYQPLVRNDLQEIKRLLHTLGTLSAHEKDKIYTLASSTIINGDIMRNSCSTLTAYHSVCQKILRTNDVDSRDGYPSQINQAKFIILADPIQYHLRPDAQKVIGIPAKELLNNYGLGKYYKRLPYEFTLTDMVKVYIYQKK